MIVTKAAHAFNVAADAAAISCASRKKRKKKKRMRREKKKKRPQQKDPKTNKDGQQIIYKEC